MYFYFQIAFYIIYFNSAQVLYFILNQFYYYIIFFLHNLSIIKIQMYVTYSI